MAMPLLQCCNFLTGTRLLMDCVGGIVLEDFCVVLYAVVFKLWLCSKLGVFSNARDGNS